MWPGLPQTSPSRSIARAMAEPIAEESFKVVSLLADAIGRGGSAKNASKQKARASGGARMRRKLT